MTTTEILGLYNYWVVIFLMMTGFFIVIARENFIKTIIGLNIFQISVILLYVTMGKVHGGTAPIVPPEIAAAMAHDHSHHDDAHDDGAPHDAPTTALSGVHAESAAHSHPESRAESEKPAETAHLPPPSETEKRVAGTQAAEDGKIESANEEDLAPENSIVHSSPIRDQDYAISRANGTEVEGSRIIYSNPLPSVLMLTAIVVGVATTALALALIVRIREDYGTIDEHDVLELDRKS